MRLKIEKILKDRVEYLKKMDKGDLLLHLQQVSQYEGCCRNCGEDYNIMNRGIYDSLYETRYCYSCNNYTELVKKDCICDEAYVECINSELGEYGSLGCSVVKLGHEGIARELLYNYKMQKEIHKILNKKDKQKWFDYYQKLYKIS